MSADDTHELRAEFEILDWQDEAYDEPAEGPKLSRAKVTKRYRGEIEGDGIAQMLTAQDERGAGYVASERIVGTLAGRRGSFVLQHGGLLDGGVSTNFGTVVPASGTGELAGLRGTLTTVTHDGLTLRYTL